LRHKSKANIRIGEVTNRIQKGTRQTRRFHASTIASEG
jgi:hypothetical protein